MNYEMKETVVENQGNKIEAIMSLEEEHVSIGSEV